MSRSLGIKFIPVSMCAVYSCTIATANEVAGSLAVWILQFKNSLCSVQVSVLYLQNHILYKRTFI